MESRLSRAAVRAGPLAATAPNTDLAVAVACVAGLLAVAALLFRDAGTRRAEPAAGDVARLAHAEGDVLRRPAGTLAWEPARAGSGLRVNDSVYVPPGASASLHFEGGSTLEVEERSLVVVESPEPSRPSLALLKGSLSGSAGAGGLTLRAADSLALLEPGSAARLASPRAARAELDVLSGRAIVGSEILAAPGGVRLESPGRNQRLYAGRFPAWLELRWDGEASAGLRAEVARDAGFAERIAVGPGETGALDVEAPMPGAYYWRLADEGGRPRSEARKLVVLADRPPTPFAPMAGEIVLAPPGVQVPFWWTPVDGASRYQLELAAEPSFRNLALTAEASGPGLWTALELPEGVYYWRVRVRRPERGDSPFSIPTPFRLARRPLPEAPRLFDPTIEVEHGHAR